MSHSSKLYRGTPYLQSLQEQMGTSFNEVVQAEIQRFKSVRQNLKTKIEESDGGAPKARKTLEKLPSALRHTGAFVAGPRTLPRGENTGLPLIVRSNDGSRYVIGYISVHTTIGGTWQMVGYDTNGGTPEVLEKEVVSYEPDDVEHAMGELDSFLQTVDQVAGSYIQLDQKRSSKAVGAAQLMGENLDEVGMDDDLAIGMSESSSSESGNPSGGQSSGGTVMDKINQNARRILGQGQTSGKTLIRSDKGGKALNKREVLDRLKRGKYKHNAPPWYTKLKNNRHSQKKKWRLFAKIAQQVYNKMRQLDQKGQAKSINAFWMILGKYCLKKGLMNKHYCWETSNKIDPDQNGRCNLREQCPKYKSDDNGRCVNQSVAQ